MGSCHGSARYAKQVKLFLNLISRVGGQKAVRLSFYKTSEFFDLNQRN
jgi:hypothetical protein